MKSYCDRCKHFNADMGTDIYEYRPCKLYGTTKYKCDGYVEVVDERGWTWVKERTPTAAAPYLVELDNGDYAVYEWYKGFFGGGMRWSGPRTVIKWKEIV